MRYDIDNRIGHRATERAVASCEELRDAQAIRDALRCRYCVPVAVRDTWENTPARKDV